MLTGYYAATHDLHTLVSPPSLHWPSLWASVAIEGFVLYIGEDHSCTLNVMLLVQCFGRT